MKDAKNKATRSKSVRVISGIKAGEPTPIPWKPPVGDPLPPERTLS